MLPRVSSVSAVPPPAACTMTGCAACATPLPSSFSTPRTQILHRAQLAHVLPLQVGKFLGHIVGIHAL